MSEVEDASILGGNLTAVEAISAKLAEVTRLAEKLDARLCEAGARTRPMSIPTAVTSSASSLLSISAMSPLNVPVHTTALTSGITASAVSVIPQMHPIASETVATRIKSDEIKSITPTTEKFDETLLHICSHSAEDVETSNKDFNTKVHQHVLILIYRYLFSFFLKKENILKYSQNAFIFFLFYRDWPKILVAKVQ